MSQILFITVFIAGLAYAGLSIFGSILYDLSLAKINKQARIHPYTRALRMRPKVTVIVLASSDASQLHRSLESIAKNNYRKYEIVVAAKNKAPINSVVKTFKKKYPKKNIKTIKTSGNNYESIVNKLDKRGIAIVINDNYILGRTAISETVKYFALNQDTSILKAHITNVFDFTLPSLVRQYEYSIKNQWHKASSGLFKLNSNNDEGFTALKLSLNKDGESKFCSNIKVYERGKKHSKLIKRSIPKLALIPTVFAVLSYAIYLAFASHYVALLFLVWSGFTLFLILNIWADEQFSTTEKIRLFALSPMVSFLFYITLPSKLFKQFV
jgi:hypothetical protein